jgi:hypothetical protein
MSKKEEFWDDLVLGPDEYYDYLDDGSKVICKKDEVAIISERMARHIEHHIERRGPPHAYDNPDF